MLILPALALLLAGALFINALLRPASRAGYALGLFVAAYAQIVLISQAASLLNGIGAPVYLACGAALAAASWWLWRKQGCPDLLGPFAGGKWRIWRGVRFAWRDLPLWLLAGGVAASLLVGALQILLLPQNNYDSLVYHLPRVGYWMQHQTLAGWPTLDTRQVNFPPNAELGILWGAVFTGGDRLAGFVQWFSALFSALAIAGLARLVGGGYRQSLFAGLLCLTLPQVVLQSTTSQNDLAVTVFALACVYFLRLGLAEGCPGSLLYSGAAFGLALGSKTTFVFLLPGLALAVIVWFFSRGVKQWRLWRNWAVACLAGTVLFGGYIYAQNIITYRHPFGQYETGSLEAALAGGRMETALHNAALYTYQMFDGSGLPSALDEPFMQLKRRVFGRLFRELGMSGDFAKMSVQQILALPTRIHEDLSWFGPLGFLVFLPVVFVQLVNGIRRRAYDWLALLALGTGFFAALCYLMGWTLFKGRYFVLGVGLAAPLLAFVYHPRRWVIPAGVALLALTTLFITVIGNEAKPLVGANAVFGRDRIALRAMNAPFMEAITRKVDEVIPDGARVAVKMGPNGLEHLIFGEAFQRELMQVDQAITARDTSILKETGAEFFVVGPREQFFINLPPGLELIAALDQTSLYRVNQQALENTPEDLPYPAADPNRFILTDPALTQTVGVIESWGGQWGVEQNQEGGYYWLGRGEVQGFGMRVLADADLQFSLVLEVDAGPSRQDGERNLVVKVFTPDGLSQTYPAQFTASGRLRLPVMLKQGVNEIGMYVLDSADVFELPNGDTRTLLVRLNRIRFAP